MSSHPREPGGEQGRWRRPWARVQALLRRELPLFPSVTLVAAFALVALAILVPTVRWYTTGAWAWLPSTPAERPSSLEILRLAATFVAGLGGIVALTVAYRRQREQERRRDSLRFDAAAQQLGSEDGAIRLAGVYAAVALADESARFRPAVVQFLCAYLRLNRNGDGPVQQTILETIGQHTVASPAGAPPWTAFDFDLHGIEVGDRLHWSKCRFDGRVDLEAAVLRQDVELVRAEFRGQLTLSQARFERACFASSAQFHGTVLMNSTRFSGGLHAHGSHFERGLQADRAVFNEAASFTSSRFNNGVVFTGAKFDIALFSKCTFALGEPGYEGDITYENRAIFRKAELGNADFSGATFLTEAHFDRAVFSGQPPRFSRTKFLAGGSIRGAKFPDAMPDALQHLWGAPGAPDGGA